MIEEICKCGEKAVWLYMPTSKSYPFFCDDCVPRGCSCNRRYFDEEDTHYINKAGSYVLEHMIKYNVKFRIEDRMINGESAPYLSHKYVTELDDRGRELPCVEFMHLKLDHQLIEKIYEKTEA